jgi:GT2 family glycosyltransferase
METWVVDNGSTDGSAELVRRRFPWVRLLVNHENQGFARANNQAMSLTRGRYLLFLNPDTQLLPESLRVLVGFLDRHPRTGAVAPQVLSPEGRIQPSCRRFPTLGAVFWEATGLDRALPKHPLFGHYLMGDWDHEGLCPVDQPMGACLMVRRRALDQIGPWDERFFLFFEEVDLCRRLKTLGWDIYFVPQAQIIHHGGHSTGQDYRRACWLFHSSRYKYFRKHFGRSQEWLMRALMVASFPWQLLLRVVLVLSTPMDRSRMARHFNAVVVQLASALWPT